MLHALLLTFFFLFHFPAASAKHNKMKSGPPPPPGKSPKKQTTDVVKIKTPHLVPSTIAPPIESPVAVNHLFIGHKSHSSKRNRHVTDAPRIAPIYPKSTLTNLQYPPLGKSAKAKARAQVSPKKDDKSPTPTGQGSTTGAGDSNLKEREKEESGSNKSEPNSPTHSAGAPPSSSQSSDGCQSEASNYTRDSTTDLESDTDTIEGTPDKGQGSRSDIANLNDIEDEKLLIDLENELKDLQSERSEKENDVNSEDSAIKQVANNSANAEVSSVKETGDDKVSSEDNVSISSSNSSSASSPSKVFQSSTSSRSKQGSRSSSVEDGNIEFAIETNQVQQQPSSPGNNNNNETKPTLLKLASMTPQTGSSEITTTESQKSPTSHVENLQGVEKRSEYVAKMTYKTSKKLQMDSNTSVPNTVDGFQSDEDSDSNQSTSPQKNGGPAAGKTFNPFANRPIINERRAQNGIRLGLYSPDDISSQNSKKLTVSQERGVNNIGRAQINACLHRQYMAEVKQQAKNRRH